MSSGPAIWDFRARLNIETVGAQSQASVRERTVRIRYYYHKTKLKTDPPTPCDSGQYPKWEQ